MSSRSDTILSRIRWSGALAALAALAALVAIGPPGSARASAATGSSFDQITGSGLTPSAVTVSWKEGLLNDSNQAITASNAVRNDPTQANTPLYFMYQDPDFQNLQVKVSQTEDLADQGITVSWSGASPTNFVGGAPADNVLQIMECYGDSSSGPSPQDCEFGTDSQLGGQTGSLMSTRGGDLCAASTQPPGPGNPIASLNGQNALWGCDPEEPVQGASASDVSPTDPTQYEVPFVPAPAADGTQGSPAYGRDETNQYFNAFNSNEVEAAVSGSDGSGETQFVTLTGTQAPGLGCGLLDPSTGQSRNCWLVIVPRGEYEPNGYQVNPNPGAPESAGSYIVSSPLSASNWAMRIQVHLDYAPQQNFCPIGTKETETVGTQLVERAVQSWQLALNAQANCSRIFGYSAVTEAESTTQLDNSSSGVGLAFTTIPIGSEAARDGTAPPPNPLPPMLYAPVAVTADAFGFNISNANGFYATPVDLSPELLAKALTQTYASDIPDYYPTATVGSQAGGVGIVNPVNDVGPPWLGQNLTGTSGNPLNISFDGQFQALNGTQPKVFPNGTFANGNGFAPLAPMLTPDNSALNQQIWQWIQADPGAKAWLNKGTQGIIAPGNALSENVDPSYEKLQLGTPPAIDSFPRAYSCVTGALCKNGCLNEGPDIPESGSPVKDVTRCSLDLLPYVNNYDQAATNILAGIDPVFIHWDSEAIAPDGSTGWWDTEPPQQLGSRWLWGISDTSDLAADGLVDAQLCSNAGTNCVGPSTASLTAALDSAKADSTGLLEVNPASPGTGGYPLTQVVYAAVPTNQPAAELNDYADLIDYAATAGQTPGSTSGDLPPGYLPLPANLQAKAMAVVAQLRADASPAPSPSTSSTTASQPASGTGTGTGSNSLTPSGGGRPVSSTTPVAGVSIRPPSAQLAAARTPGQPVGSVRWLLLAVVIAGAACAISGTVLRSDGVVRWLRRMRA